MLPATNYQLRKHCSMSSMGFCKAFALQKGFVLPL